MCPFVITQMKYRKVSVSDIRLCLVPNRSDSYLLVLESVVEIPVPQAGDVSHVLSGEPGYPGREVQREGQLDQLGCRRQDGGRVMGRRRLRLQVGVGQLLEGGVRHPVEEVAQRGVVSQLEETGKGVCQYLQNTLTLPGFYC